MALLNGSALARTQTHSESMYAFTRRVLNERALIAYLLASQEQGGSGKDVSDDSSAR